MIDQSKTYRTRRGAPARIYAVDGGGDFPIHGAVEHPDGWNIASWRVDGKYSRLDGKLDLIESDPHGILPRHREKGE